MHRKSQVRMAERREQDGGLGICDGKFPSISHCSIKASMGIGFHKQVLKEGL